METIGEVLKKIREERKLYLEDVKSKTGINKTLLDKIETGKRLPTKEQVIQLSKFYNVEKNDLIIQWLSDKLVYEVRDEESAHEKLQVSEKKVKFTITNKERHIITINNNTENKTIEELKNKVIQGDCLEIMKSFPSKSIDMILCDLPYGTTQNKWDSVIDLDKLWKQYNRIIKDEGAIVLTSQGVFTARLILSNEKDFKYKIVWIKSKATNFLNAKKQPLRKHEDICVFYKKQPTYTPQMSEGEAYDKGIRKDQFTGSYGEFEPRHVKSNGQRYPTDVIAYDLDYEDYIYVKTAESEGEVYHPTQKPIELGRYLIKTFTKPGNIILDNACGSGSFLLSAILENRNFIGIEKKCPILMEAIEKELSKKQKSENEPRINSFTYF